MAFRLYFLCLLISKLCTVPNEKYIHVLHLLRIVRARWPTPASPTQTHLELKVRPQKKEGESTAHETFPFAPPPSFDPKFCTVKEGKKVFLPSVVHVGGKMGGRGGRCLHSLPPLFRLEISRKGWVRKKALRGTKT